MGRRVKTLVQLLGLLVLICLFALQAGWFEEKRDQVQTSKVLKPIPQSSLNKPDQPINTESVVHPSTVPVSISSNEEAPKPRKKANSKPVLIDYDKSSSDFYDLLPDLKRPVVPLNKLSYSEDDTISTDKPICPTWTAYDVNTQAAKDFSDNCRDVPVAPSYESMFSVNLCESKTHCGQGYFLIERKDLYECYEEFNQLLSHNEQLDAYLKKNIGPDAFHMIFSGPERAAPTMWHQLSPCIYKLPYRLTNSGTYTLNLIHSHTNFSAINEVANKYPSPLVTPILPTNFTLSICPTCPVFTPKSVTSLDLPLCPRHLPTQGIYLKTTLETTRELYKHKNYYKPYIWTPLGCKYDQLFELDALSTCHSSRNYSVYMYGDSHNRVLWDAVDVRLAGSKRALGKKPKDGDRDAVYYEDRMTGFGYTGDGRVLGRAYRLRNSVMNTWLHRVNRTAGGTRVRHVWGNYLQKLVYDFGGWDNERGVVELDKVLGEFDVFEFDWGHWGSGPEKNNGHFTVERFLDLLELAADYLVQVNSRRDRLGLGPLKVIWQGVNSIPLIRYEKGEWQADDKDWRTNYRFKIWSMFAERAMLRRGFSVINSFDITFPWIQETEDQNHVHTLPALDAQVDELLHKLNICNY